MPLTLSILFSRNKTKEKHRHRKPSPALDHSDPKAVVRVCGVEAYVEVLLKEDTVANARPRFVRIGDGNIKCLSNYSVSISNY